MDCFYYKKNSDDVWGNQAHLISNLSELELHKISSSQHFGQTRFLIWLPLCCVFFFFLLLLVCFIKKQCNCKDGEQTWYTTPVYAHKQSKKIIVDGKLQVCVPQTCCFLFFSMCVCDWGLLEVYLQCFSDVYVTWLNTRMANGFSSPFRLMQPDNRERQRLWGNTIYATVHSFWFNQMM